MSDIQALLTALDELSPSELEQVYQHVVQRRAPAYWLIPGENLQAIREIMRPIYDQTASMSENEVNATIDEALNEVRRERKSKTHRGHCYSTHFAGYLE
jgi:hypothetical protein